MGERLKKIEEKWDAKRLLFRVFDEPRPKYVAKVTIIDRVIDVLFLWAFSERVRPNHITVFRFLTIPFIIWLLFAGWYGWALILFVISAFSDAVDGAIARTRNQITDWGIVFDPLADKLLIGIVGGILIFTFLNPFLALIIIGLELVLIITSYYRFQGGIVPAKTVGKLKMVFQCFGVGFIFLGLALGVPVLFLIAQWLLYIAVVLAVLSILVYKSI